MFILHTCFSCGGRQGRTASRRETVNGCYEETQSGDTGSGHVVFPSSLGPSAEET